MTVFLGFAMLYIGVRQCHACEHPEIACTNPADSFLSKFRQDLPFFEAFKKIEETLSNLPDVYFRDFPIMKAAKALGLLGTDLKWILLIPGVFGLNMFGALKIHGGSCLVFKFECSPSSALCFEPCSGDLVAEADTT